MVAYTKPQQRKKMKGQEEGKTRSTLLILDVREGDL